MSELDKPEEERNDDLVVMEADTEPVTLPRGVLRAVLDAATQTLDFGSGFLCDAEVIALRTLAEAIGLDPDVATPDSHLCQYQGHKMVEHEYELEWYGVTSAFVCSRCGEGRPERRPMTPEEVREAEANWRLAHTSTTLIVSTGTAEGSG